MSSAPTGGLSLAPFRAARYAVDPSRLGRLLCPPYDVVDDRQRRALLDGDPDNAVSVILPVAPDGADPYEQAAGRLARWVDGGLLASDPVDALYVYEMTATDGARTRGLVGAVELRDPADGVILPHEDTMAGPVADRLALMLATEANLEPIYLVYDGGGAATQVVESVDPATAIAEASTPDGLTHRLWAVTDGEALRAVADDLDSRRALIADGHHRYATYREMQRRLRAEHGQGPWDRGLTLLVDTASYGPQVHAIHRVLAAVPFDAAVEAAGERLQVTPVATAGDGLSRLEAIDDFAAVLTDGERAVVIAQPDPALVQAATRADEPSALGRLDVTVLHRALVPDVWHLADSVDAVGYAHSVEEAVSAARDAGGTAVLMRPTPVAAVAAVAAAGARMPRKSTLFTPKPASGMLFRRFVDQRG